MKHILLVKEKNQLMLILDIDGIIEIAKNSDVDAIHPGYGFSIGKYSLC